MSSDELLHTIRLLQKELRGMEKVLAAKPGDISGQTPASISELLEIIEQLQGFIVSEKLTKTVPEENIITARKPEEGDATEASLPAQTRQLSALHTATSMLLSTLDLETLLGQIIDAATNAIPAAEKGILYLIARDTGNLEIRATMGYTDPRIQKLALPGSKGYVQEAIQKCKPLLIHDILTPFPPAEVSEARSAIIAPLVLDNRAQGALALHSSQEFAFNEDDLQLLVSFAATATAALRNAQLHADVQRQAITDTLTNLYNRRGLFELGRREIERARRYGRPISAIMLDIDQLKRINDTYGHKVGDQALIGFAERLTKNVRHIDVLGRYGGDEFAILLPETDRFSASQVAERLRYCVIEKPLLTDPEPVNITASFGVARLNLEIPDLAVLLHQADEAMYVAKQNGGNRVEMR